MNGINFFYSYCVCVIHKRSHRIQAALTSKFPASCGAKPFIFSGSHTWDFDFGLLPKLAVCVCQCQGSASLHFVRGDNFLLHSVP